MKKIKGDSLRPRLAVFRSNKEIYAQIIDDERGETLVAENSLSLKTELAKLTKTQQALAVGEALAQKAKALKIKKVKFDRRSYKYHGRVKFLAEGARKGGLDF